MPRADKRPILCSVLLLTAACAAAPRPKPPTRPAPGPAASARVIAPARSGCEAFSNLRALLAKHARSYGSRARVLAALPVQFAGTVAMAGKTGKFDLVEARGKYRETLQVAGMTLADGIDGAGAWTDGPAGVAARLHDDEAIDERLQRWVDERTYLTDLLLPRARAVAKCALDDHGRARVTVATRLAELGNPTLVFDANGTLVSVRYEGSTGDHVEQDFGAWSTPSEGVRWPSEVTTRPELGPAVVEKTTRQTRGLESCATGACFAPPASSLGLTTNGAATHVPMSFYLSEISVRASVGGRKVFALLDSGASVSALDATTPLGAAFKPALSMEGSGATQKVKFGLGFIRNVALGGLSVSRLPVVSVPIPALDAYGARRPELILGFSLFLSRAIRIDYAKNDLVLASDAKSLIGPGAVKVPLRLWDNKLIAPVEIEGVHCMAQIDTGNAGAFDVYKRWADAHGVLTHHKTLQVRGRFGAGTHATTETFWRMKRGSLGPVTVESRIAELDNPPATGNIAGLVGNKVLSKCSAVVLDTRGRALWLVPPCNRRVPENLAGWTLVKSASPKRAATPWKIGAVFPGGSADRAGIRAGDRLISVGGRRAVLDLGSFEHETERPAGTRVRVIVERDGKRLSKTMTLAPVLE